MLRLLLPALLPSWRFFDVIGPSPRIEYQVYCSHKQAAESWREFQPRPLHISLRSRLQRLIWNPQWNESLFLVSCAEKLLTEESSHAATILQDRIARQLLPTEREGTDTLRFRLRLIFRENNQRAEEIVYVSGPYPLTSQSESHQ